MMRQLDRSIRLHRPGTIYIVVMGVSLIVMTLAVGGILAGRALARGANTSSDAMDAQLAAQSGIELARYRINQDASWRTTFSAGTISSGVSIGGALVSVVATDPTDGNLGNRPHDSVLLTARATKGTAARVITQTLVASPTPLPILQYALQVGGQLHTKGTGRLIIGSGTASTNADLRNENALEGNADIFSLTTRGTIYGTVNSGSSAKTMPASTVAESYASLGTLISPGGSINGMLLTPTYNPFGAANADGVYVIRPGGNLTIANSRVYGTLVIIANGKKITIDNSVLLQAYRSDYPALIIVGDATFQFDSTGSLTEAAAGGNLNPAGAAYLGVTDSDASDSYPCEIDGLVDVTGQMQITKPCIIRGALICESTANSDAVLINNANCTINYTSSLYTSPPQFYTSGVKMIPQSGSIAQVAN